jgi:uncharacterized OsmC-like protein
MSSQIEAEKGAGNKVMLELLSGYRFRVTFSDADRTTLIMDEPPPLGEGKGPNASRVLTAAVLNCLSASLVFCLNKSRIAVRGIRGEAEPLIARNAEGYWRVTKISVSLYPEFEDAPDQAKLSRCLAIFENFCVVTGAVRSGLTVDVKVNTPPPATPTQKQSDTDTAKNPS